MNKKQLQNLLQRGMLKEAIVKLYGKIRYSRDLIYELKDRMEALEKTSKTEKKTSK